MTLTIQLLDSAPYRTSTLRHYCDVCQEQAQTRCLCCGKTFCLLHSSSSRYCMSCEGKIKVLGFGITAAVGLAVTAPAVILAMLAGVGFVLIAIFLALALVIVGLLSGVGRWVALERLRTCSPEAEALLEDVEILVAARTAEDSSISRGRGRRSGHSAGAMPSVPMYQRTYGVG